MPSAKAAVSSGYQVVLRNAVDLIPYARNSRTHSDEQISKVMASLVEFGWTNPILLDDATGVIAGHGRMIAALRLYDQGKQIRMPSGEQLPVGMVPTINCAGWTEAQKRAYIIADNALAAEAGWDGTLLGLELQDLTSMDFNLDLLGFSPDNLAAALGTASLGGNDDVKELLTDPDEVPPAPKDPVSAPGDVWLLGPHRLVCGDCTDADTVAKALGGITPMLMVTDQPYGVEYDADRRARGMTDGFQRAKGKVANDDRADWAEAWSLFPGDVAYVWHGYRKAYEAEGGLRAAGFFPRAQIVWRKVRMTLSPANINVKTMGYNPQHECCFYAIRDGAAPKWAGNRSQSTVWDIDHAKSETGHSTQKPVECMRRPMENNSAPGQPVYDPFMGSGTSIIAAEQIGRVSLGVELNPAYVDVAVIRWQNATGKPARLEATGESYEDLAGIRLP